MTLDGAAGGLDGLPDSPLRRSACRCRHQRSCQGNDEVKIPHSEMRVCSPTGKRVLSRARALFYVNRKLLSTIFETEASMVSLLMLFFCFVFHHVLSGSIAFIPRIRVTSPQSMVLSPLVTTLVGLNPSSRVSLPNRATPANPITLPRKLRDPPLLSQIVVEDERIASLVLCKASQPGGPCRPPLNQV